MTSRQVLYGSLWTPYNGADGNNPRPFSYWADLGVSDMLMWKSMPGTNGGPPAVYAPLGADAQFVVNQAKDAGINLILGTKLHGYYGLGTPTHAAPFNPPSGTTVQRDWLNDPAFQATLITAAHTLGRWAKENGYIGVFFDEEISSSNDGWTYAGYKLMFPTSPLTQAQAELEAYRLGLAWMGAFVAEFPGLEYHNYSASGWPGGWSAFSRSKFTITPTNPGTPSLQNFFYKGVAAIAGYKHIYFWNADFYGGQYHSVAGATYPYGGKVYDSWQWGSVQFDRDGCKRYWSTFFDAGTDLSKVDIVPFVAMGAIEGGPAGNLAYQTKLPGQASYVNEQFVPSINQIVPGNNNGNPWHGEPDKPVPLFGHYAYGQDADVWVGRNADGTPKLATGTVDYAPFRPALRAAVGLPTSPPTTRTVTVTVSDGVSSVTTPVQVKI